jgi:hypothetical protein
MPESRTRGPSAHQIGPSPSQTRCGVQVKDWPAATIWVSMRRIDIVRASDTLRELARGSRMARGRTQKPDQGGCGLLLLVGIVVIAIGRCGGTSDPAALSNGTSILATPSSAIYRYVDVERLNCRSEPRRNARRVPVLRAARS